MSNQRKKTAIIAICLNVCLTALKFLLYFVSGSIAIVAEAWHSFSDIISSSLVYIAIKKDNNAPEPSADQPGQEASPKADASNFLDNFLYMSLEYKISLLIGVFLILVAFNIFRKSVIFVSAQIQSPLISGLAFIFFGLCSYFIYKFEKHVGMEENSAALISDAMHARTDMISSLLVGFSLIFYKLGINVDRPTAFVIAILIFGIGLDILINLASTVIKSEAYTFRYRTIEVIGFVFRKQKWQDLIMHMDQKLNLGLENSKIYQFIRGYFLIMVFALLGFFYFSTCFFTVKPYQQAIIERFGVPVNKSCPVEPGLNIKWPWPIDKAIKIDARVVRKMNIGNIQDENTFALLWTKDHGQEEPFLSGDNNFFYPYFTVHYKVKNIFHFRYKNKDPNELLKNVAYRVVTNICARKDFYEIITNYRENFEADARQVTQAEIDALELGIEITGFYAKDIHPPMFIANSFEDVIAAYQDKKRMINNALGYRNGAIPKARGEACQRLKQAEAYVVTKINHAQGDGTRFEKQVDAVAIRRDVSLKRLFYQYLSEGLKDKQKIIIDPASGMPEIWLDADQILKAPTLTR